MLTQAPRGMYRVIGLAPIDTLTWPSGPLWKDCETLDEARDLADCNGDLYAWVYVYNDAGEILYESGSERQQHLEPAHARGHAGGQDDSGHLTPQPPSLIHSLRS